MGDTGADRGAEAGEKRAETRVVQEQRAKARAAGEGGGVGAKRGAGKARAPEQRGEQERCKRRSREENRGDAKNRGEKKAAYFDSAVKMAGATSIRRRGWSEHWRRAQFSGGGGEMQGARTLALCHWGSGSALLLYSASLPLGARLVACSRSAAQAFLDPL